MNNARKMLRNFYDQALLTPDLLCLNCAYMNWRNQRARCSDARKENCLFFVNDMLNWLVSEPKAQRRPMAHK